MKRLQEHHWWWRGTRHLYRTALARFVNGSGQRTRRILDVGCGFGANLPVLNPLGQAVGLDTSLDVLRTIPVRPTLGLVQASAEALPFRAGTFDVVALLAVIEHIDHDASVLAESYRVARPGDIQILLTSAFTMLRSHHDEANAHRRRYRSNQLDQLQYGASWHTLVTSYVNATIFPAVAVVRIMQRHLMNGKRVSLAEYDMGLDLEPLNWLLERLLAAEAWMVIHGIALPFGVNLLSVARRDDSA